MHCGNRWVTRGFPWYRPPTRQDKRLLLLSVWRRGCERPTTFLGGLGEIGRNCAAIEIDGRIAPRGLRAHVPPRGHVGGRPGVADWGWLVERRDDILCVVLTHGHEDHMGGLGYFLDEVPVPVYGTRLSLAIAAGEWTRWGSRRTSVR